MDINLSTEDLQFRDEVRSFFEENKIKQGEDYFAWREGWFKKAREKGGWDVPSGQLNLVDQDGHLLNITFGNKKQLKQIYPSTFHLDWACWLQYL